MSLLSKRAFSLITRRKFLRLLAITGSAGAATILYTACSSQSATQSISRPASVDDVLNDLSGLDFDTFIDESFRQWALRDPEFITENGLSTYCNSGNDTLTDISDEYISQTQRLEAGLLQLLNAYDPNGLSSTQALTASIYNWILDDLVSGHPFMYHNYPVTPFLNCTTFNIYSLFTDLQPLATYDDAQIYIDRLSQLGTKWDQLVAGLARREELGVCLPQCLIPSAVEILENVICGPTPITEFTTSFQERIGEIEGLTDEQSQELLGQMNTVCGDIVFPAYQRVIDHMISVEPSAPTDIGVWQFPNGYEYYSHLLHHYTSTELTAEEIHSIGLENTERIIDEIYTAAGQLGYSRDLSLAALTGRLYTRDGVVSGNAATRAFQDAIETGFAYLSEAFDLIPETPVEVIPGSQGNYLSAVPVDGSHPAYFYAITNQLIPNYVIPSIAFHETYPGHALQLSLAAELNLPMVQKVTGIIGYVEGWALYAERLMWELGAFDREPGGNIGRLLLELLRAVRLVADTGIHAMQWTWDEVTQYQISTLGYSTERERYISLPGQATAYYIGYLKILELRQRAMDALGAGFDLRSFHRVVLQNGSLPLSVLEQLIDNYIREANNS